MIIIIEGVDCTGKSTLAEELRQRAQDAGEEVEMIHMGVPQADPLIEYEFALSGYRPGSGRTIICDRWHLGADVYGPLKRLDDGLLNASRWHIEAFLRSRGAFLVLTAPINEKTHLEMMRERGEDYITEEEAILVAGGFETAYRKSSLAKTRMSIPFDTEMIMMKARAAEAGAKALAPFHSYVGPLRPRTLLLGDRKKRDEKTTEIQMSAEGAFAPYGSSSGKFLINSLLITAPEPSDMSTFGIANANEEEVDRLWDALYNPLVVALGNEAHLACEKAHVPHKWAYHPAYMRRFMHSKKTTYGLELR